MTVGFSLDNIEFSPDTLRKLPNHSALLGQIVTSFSLIEGVVGGIYGMLRHQDIEAAVQHLKDLRTNAMRVHAVKKEIENDATLSLVPANAELMDAILRYAEKRNKVAHGIWGYDADKPDMAFRLPVKKWINFVAKIVASGTAGNSDEQIDELKSELEEYSLDMLQSLKTEGTAILQAVLELFNSLAMKAARSDDWTAG